jgi:cation:H+ antiporter
VQVWTVLLITGGLVVLVVGGEVLVRGAGGLARAMGMSSLVVGLTVVAFATSAPELAVTVDAVLAGTPGLAVGNVVGSNIANVLLVLGLAALLLPLAVRSQLVRADIPVMVALSVVTLLFALDGGFSRLDGAVLFTSLVVYLVAAVTFARRRARTQATAVAATDDGAARGQQAAAGGRTTTGEGEPGTAHRRPLVDLGLVVVGVALLVVGARWLVRGATDVAATFGVSDLVIGLTVVALGTSLPEIATSVVAAVRGERDMAVGNVVGSCLFNLGAVLGLAALLAPDGVPVADAAVAFDIPFMVAVALALVPIAFTGFTVARWEGALFVAYYIAYAVYVLLDATGHDALGPYSEVMLGFVVPITVVWLGLLVAYEVGLRRGRGRDVR